MSHAILNAYYFVSACTNQQAPLCQRHSQVQTGSKDLLQADQRPVNNHLLRIQGIPAGGVKGNVQSSTQSLKNGLCEEPQRTNDDVFISET